MNQSVMLRLQYDMSGTLSLPDDKKQTLLVSVTTKDNYGRPIRGYKNVRGKIKSIDVYSIDSDNNLLDKDNNVIMEPDNIDPVPLRINNPKIFAATGIN